IFRLNTNVGVCLKDRAGKQPYAGGLDDIKYLSPDFLEIEKKIKREARKVAKETLGASGWKYAFLSIFLPIALGFAPAYGTYVIATHYEIQGIKANEQQKSYENKVDKKIDSLTKIIEQLQMDQKPKSTGSH